MVRSNLTTNLMLWLLSTILVVGCVKAQKHDPYGSDKGKQTVFTMRAGPRGAKEIIDTTQYTENLLTSNDIEAKLASDVSVVDPENAAYSNRRQYSMKLCGLQDIRARNNVLGQKMKVYSEVEIVKPDLVIQTDDCVYWTITLPFNYFADAYNLDLNFIFIVESGAKTFIHKKVLINPWDAKRGNNREFYDYTRFGLTEEEKKMRIAHGLDDILLALAGSLDEKPKRLEIGSVTISPVVKNKKNYESAESNLVGTDINGDLQKQNERLKAVEARQRLTQRAADGSLPAVLETLDLHLNIKLNALKIRLGNSADVVDYEELKTGRYQIYAQLIASDLDETGHYIITNDMLVSDMSGWKQNSMGVNGVLPISLVIRPQWGNLNLALRVVPLDLPANVKPFEGLYNLGRFNDLAGGKSPMFDLSGFTKETNGDLIFNLDQYLGASINHDDWMKGNAAANVKGDGTLQKGFKRFQFSTLNVLFSRVVPGDTATDRTIQYTVETCVIDTNGGIKVGANLRFNIETEDRGIIIKDEYKTNEQGCLNWVGMISHKYYQRENLMPKKSTLTYMGGDGTGQKYELSYYINPWDEKFTFGRDSRVLPQKYIDEIKAQQEVAPPTKVLISDFKYDATGFRYVIDKYMNLTVKKTVNMVLHPKVLKYNSIVWGRSGSNDLRDGIYLLKVAMQKDYLDPAAPGRKIIYDDSTDTYSVESSEKTIQKRQFLVVKEMLVRVLGGNIVTPIEFDIRDLRTLRIRSQMLIQIETIDEMLLRAIALADIKLNSLLGQGNKPDTLSVKTGQIIDLQKNSEDINKLINEAKERGDLKEVQEYISKLQSQDKEVLAKLKTVLTSLDAGSLENLLGNIDRMRKAGQSAVSSDRNIKYQTLNRMLKSLRAKLAEEQKTQVSKLTRDHEQYMKEECRKYYSTILNGTTDYNDGSTVSASGMSEEDYKKAVAKAKAEGKTCHTSIPKNELFYYLTSSGDVESDQLYQALFTKEEYSLLQNNGFMDDFTKAYLPNYDFSLLSNQGDELAPDPVTKRADPKASGLARRTFIGPVTFVLNGNSSAMRPTDVLDEASCQGTCEQVDDVEVELSTQGEVLVSAMSTIKAMGLGVNSAYEESPYYGSIKHFYKKQVDDLIGMEKALKHQYSQEMKAFSQVGNLLDQLLINYVSMGERQKNVNTLDYDCYTKWKSDMDDIYSKWREGTLVEYKVSNISEACFKNSGRVMTKKAFLAKLNKPEANEFSDRRMARARDFGPISSDEMKKFAKNGMYAPDLNFDKKVDILHALCAQMRSSLFSGSEANFNKTAMAKAVEDSKQFAMMNADSIAYDTLKNQVRKFDYFENSCHKLVNQYADDIRKVAGSMTPSQLRTFMASKARQLPITIERKVRVLETTNRYIYKDGKTINYSVGTSFSLSNNFNQNKGLKVDPIETAEKTLGSFLRPVGTIIGAVAGMFNFQWGANESEGVSNGTSVSSGTTIAGQISTLDIELKRWEKCIIVKPESKFFVEQVRSLTKNNPYYDARQQISSLGTMICSGEEDTKDEFNKGMPLRVRERYYYFTQIFNEGDMQDPGSLANHPWMLQLRGVRDFTRFHVALTATKREINWGSPFGTMFNDVSSILVQGEQRHNDPSSFMVVAADDVDKSLEMMGEAYSHALPTFPGMYTFSESSDDTVTNWPE